jgi:uncharacterized membrane protein YqjE
MDDQALPSGPVTQLLRSAMQLFASLLSAAQTRAELLTTEVEEEIQRVARVLLLGFAALLSAILGLLVAGFAVVVAFWDTHRTEATMGVLAVFVIAALGFGQALRANLRARPRLLDATRAELEKDVARLRDAP